MTIEQLWNHAGDGRSELVRKEFIPLQPLYMLQGLLVAWLIFKMSQFVDDAGLGECVCSVGCILFRNPDTVRGPNIAFISAARIPKPLVDAFLEGAPDLAVEVLSPDDLASKVLQKVRDYLAAGSRLVWIVDPDNSTVTAYRPDGTARIYSGQDEVSGEDVLPGFSFRPDNLFNAEA